MKKYIIGLFSAICLMGAGCTEFEDYEPVAMGDGPSVTVALEKTAIDAFNLTVTPGGILCLHCNRPGPDHRRRDSVGEGL